MIMATIVYLTKDKAYKEMYMFRKDLYTMHDAIDAIKRTMYHQDFTFVASIIETIEEHFSKDPTSFANNAMYH